MNNNASLKGISELVTGNTAMVGELKKAFDEIEIESVRGKSTEEQFQKVHDDLEVVGKKLDKVKGEIWAASNAVRFDLYAIHDSHKELEKANSALSKLNTEMWSSVSTALLCFALFNCVVLVLFFWVGTMMK